MIATPGLLVLCSVVLASTITLLHANEVLMPHWGVLSIALAVTFRTEALFIAAFAPLHYYCRRVADAGKITATGLIYCLLLVVSTVVLAGLLTITSVSADKFRLFWSS